MRKRTMHIFRNPLLQHGVFWGLSFYVLLNIFSLSSSFQKIDFIYTLIFLISLMVPVFLNLYILIPLLLKKGRYPGYAAALAGLLFVFPWVNQLVFEKLIDYMLPGYFFISYYVYADVVKFFAVFLGSTTLLQLSKEWFELNDARQKLMQLEKEKIEAELKALSNQVNPHFLFNSLHVLYSLAVSRKEEAPEAILKLSDLLRYVIYDSSGKSTSLESEVRLINNYIDLQRYRVGEQANIRFDVRGSLNGAIAPMLLLPLVENGFKHGIKGDTQGTFLKIQLTVDAKMLTFMVENNKGIPGGNKDAEDSGVGLTNIRNRLELLYPNEHTFQIDESDGVFRVRLMIKAVLD